MIWVALAALGVPLWLCALAILTLILRNRALRRRPGNVPVRVRAAERKRWSPGHGVWIHDVFAFRGLPAAWTEVLVWASDATVRAASDEERKKLHRIGEQPIVVTVTLNEGGALELAASSEHEEGLLGPFAGAERQAVVAVPS